MNKYVWVNCEKSLFPSSSKKQNSKERGEKMTARDLGERHQISRCHALFPFTIFCLSFDECHRWERKTARSLTVVQLNNLQGRVLHKRPRRLIETDTVLAWWHGLPCFFFYKINAGSTRSSFTWTPPAFNRDIRYWFAWWHGLPCCCFFIKFRLHNARLDWSSNSIRPAYVSTGITPRNIL